MQLKVVQVGNVNYVRVPADWCQEHKIKRGDLLHFYENPDGSIVIKPGKKKVAISSE
jgi:antitoxin component of MazEF toxin-antitoxin module